MKSVFAALVLVLATGWAQAQGFPTRLGVGRVVPALPTRDEGPAAFRTPVIDKCWPIIRAAGIEAE